MADLTTSQEAPANPLTGPELFRCVQAGVDKRATSDMIKAFINAPDTFLRLLDTPPNYSGAAQQFVRVKADGTGLEFVSVAPGGGVTTFLLLTDTPDSFIGQAGKVVRVNSTANGLEFANVSLGGGAYPNPTVLDYGAVGDGSHDDGPAFQAALAAGAAGGFIVDVPAKHYRIATPIVVNVSTVVGVKWGLRGMGGSLESALTTGQTLLRINTTSTVRYLEISGLSFVGSYAADSGNGIHLFADTGAVFLYNNSLLNLTCEGFKGGAGLLIEGDVFESLVQNCYFQDNKWGAKFTNTVNGGICSAWTILSSNFSQNTENGLLSIGAPGNEYAAPWDFRVYGGYCRNNQKEGMYFWNGLLSGGSIDNVGFENNWDGTALVAGGSHVYFGTQGTLRNCSGINASGGCMYLLKGFAINRVALINCGMTGDGPSAGLTRLCHVQGNSGANAFWHLIDCDGGFDSEGNAAWRADYCTGPYPGGTMSTTLTYNS